MATYKGYNIVRTAKGVEVYHPGRPATPVYVAEDATRAKSWVRAYRDGVTWAAVEALV